MRIDEILESLKSVLYHNTNRSAAYKILRDNKIKAQSTFWRTDGLDDSEVAISLSRDKNYGEMYGSVKIEIDADKLRQTHKIKPVDLDYALTVDMGYKKPLRKTEREERVYKDIPLAYILRIYDNEDGFDHNFARNVLANNIEYFYKNKKLTKSDIPDGEYVIIDPGFTTFERGQQITKQDLHHGITQFGKNAFKYKPIDEIFNEGPVDDTFVTRRKKQLQKAADWKTKLQKHLDDLDPEERKKYKRKKKKRPDPRSEFEKRRAAQLATERDPVTGLPLDLYKDVEDAYSYIIVDADTDEGDLVAGIRTAYAMVPIGDITDNKSKQKAYKQADLKRKEMQLKLGKKLNIVLL